MVLSLWALPEAGPATLRVRVCNVQAKRGKLPGQHTQELGMSPPGVARPRPNTGEPGATHDRWVQSLFGKQETLRQVMLNPVGTSPRLRIRLPEKDVLLESTNGQAAPLTDRNTRPPSPTSPGSLVLAQTKLTASGLNPERNFSRHVRGALWDCEFALPGGASYRI